MPGRRPSRCSRDHPEINVVVGFNEPTAVGAAQAVEALGLGETVDVVGFDSNVETVNLMQTRRRLGADRTKSLCHGLSGRGGRLRPPGRREL